MGDVPTKKDTENLLFVSLIKRCRASGISFIIYWISVREMLKFLINLMQPYVSGTGMDSNGNLCQLWVFTKKQVLCDSEDVLQ